MASESEPSSSRRAFVGRAALLGAAVAALGAACTRSTSVAESHRGSASRLVALEEHYATKDLSAATGFDFAEMGGGVGPKLIDVGDRRLADMDAAGIDVQVLSAVPPAAQELPRQQAVSVARAANTSLHDGVIARWPERFGAFATLPTGDPHAAAAELEYAVTQLGFVGALINGTTGGRFLDHPDFNPILDTAAKLAVPIYLHPGFPPDAVVEAYYSGLPPDVGDELATSGYGWHYETSLHALRLVASGVFDRLPALQIILGHLGEGIPFHLARIEDKLGSATGHLHKPIGQYFRENFWITTSGYFFDGPMRLAREVFGDDRVMFSVDYPFSENKHGADWLHDLDIAPDVREKIAHTNAERLLKLS
jgi:predicted TIM-barrel fold metal-dependent hydrolase